MKHIKKYNESIDFNDIDDEEEMENDYLDIEDIKKFKQYTLVKIFEEDIHRFAKLLYDNNILWASGNVTSNNGSLSSIFAKYDREPFYLISFQRNGNGDIFITRQTTGSYKRNGVKKFNKNL